MSLILYAEILMVIIYFVFLFCKSWNQKRRRGAPPTNWPVVGMLPGLLLNVHHVHDYLTHVLQTTGMTFQVKVPWFSSVGTLITCDPANIHYILSKKFTNFPKGPEFKKIFDVLGDGIFNAESESWDIQRRTTMTVLNHPGFQKFIGTTTRNKVEKGLIPVLDDVAKLGIVVDLQEMFQRLTFDTTCILVLDHDPASLSINLQNFPYKQAFADAEEAVLYRHVLPERCWKLQRWLQIGREKKLSRAQHMIDEFLGHCISKKCKKMKFIDHQSLDYGEGEGYFDFLSGYMKALETNSGSGAGASDIPEKAWRDALLNLIFAGKDTVAATLSWFFWLLATNPIEENKIRQEILTNLHLKQDGRWNFSNLQQQLKKLIYLHGGLCETLRLFPAIALQHKAPIQADILPSGHRIKPNTKTLISFYSMARMETIWGKDCREFKPGRWITEQGGIKHFPSSKFAAFNAGPRTCLGKEMAFIQMKIVAAAVIYHFHVKLVEGHPISPSNSVILNMKHGFKIRVLRRCDS